MPQLCKDMAPFFMNDINDFFPSVDLCIRVNARGTVLPATGKAQLDRFRDDESTIRRSLRVVFQHQIARNTLWLDRSYAREWSHDHPMLQVSRAKRDRGK
jgi:hypothetical protein